MINPECVHMRPLRERENITRTKLYQKKVTL